MKKINNLMCKIGLHNKTTKINKGVVNSIPFYCTITKCKNCNKHFK